MRNNATTEQLALQSAERAGLQLIHDSDGLALTDGNLRIQGDFARLSRRLTPAKLTHELLVRAAKVKDVEAPLAIDATAGLGEDALLLAAAGFNVVLYERNPVIAALLRNALERAAHSPSDSRLAEAIVRMTLVEGDSMLALPQLKQQPDVVLLDPMFPEKRKNAAVKKKLQLLQKLEEPCGDEQALLDAAVSAHPRKVVVKRPVKGPYLAGRKPDYSLAGKAIRFDCYVGK